MKTIWKVEYPTNDWFYVIAETLEEALEIGRKIAHKDKGYSKKDANGQLIKIGFMFQTEN